MHRDPLLKRDDEIAQEVGCEDASSVLIGTQKSHVTIRHLFEPILRITGAIVLQ
jgi:hypothetical protein